MKINKYRLLNQCVLLVYCGISNMAYAASCPGGIADQTFAFTGALETYTVPAGAGELHIVVKGAEGGESRSTATSPTPGLGAILEGDFIVTPGEQFKILVGEHPTAPAAYNGGGGGSFVTKLDDSPVIIAGGGGGGVRSGPDSPSKHGQAGPNGGDGVAGSGGVLGGAGGASGNGGGIGSGGSTNPPITGERPGAAGGGLLTDGASSAVSGGSSFLNGGTGGGGGGFGGGGSALQTGPVAGLGPAGGGGGYSGGGGGSGLRTNSVTGNSGTAGGGGSFNSGTNQVSNTGATLGNSGHGEIQICASAATAPTAVPVFSIWGLGLLIAFMGFLGIKRD